MHSLTRIRAAASLIMLESAGALVPLRRMRGAMRRPAKRSSTIARPAIRTSRAKTNSDRYWPAAQVHHDPDISSKRFE